MLLIKSLNHRLKSPILILFLITCLVYFLCIPPRNQYSALMTVNGSSQYLLTKALVDRQSFQIDPDVSFANVDIAFYDGHYYSTKPPGLSFFAVPVYLTSKMLGYTLGFRNENLTFFITQSLILMNVIISALTLVIIFQIVLLLHGSRFAAMSTALIYGFLTIAWTYSGTFFRHSIATFFVTLFFYSYLRFLQFRTWRNLLGASFTLGYSILCDYALVFIPLLWLGHLIISQKNIYKPNKLLQLGFNILIGSFGSLIVIAVMNYVCCGNPFTFAYHYSIYTRETFGTNPEDLLLGLPLKEYISNALRMTLIPDNQNFVLDIYWHRALFFLSPILILGLYGFWLIKTQSRYAGLILPMFGTFVTLVAVYARWIEWHGGWCWGPRQLLPGIPFIVIPLHNVIDRGFKRLIIRLIVVILALFSFLMANIGALSRWSEESVQHLFTIPPEPWIQEYLPSWTSLTLIYLTLGLTTLYTVSLKIHYSNKKFNFT
ncbi:MAG: glycosyltransferase family 39 protein [Promethearchaeota archaeon]